jgi:hypothetical protein
LYSYNGKAEASGRFRVQKLIENSITLRESGGVALVGASAGEEVKGLRGEAAQEEGISKAFSFGTAEAVP